MLGGKRAGVIALAIGALFGGEAFAASSSARLTYVRGRGTESCPNESAFRDAVKARLGYDPFFPAAKDAIVVTLDKKSGAFVGRIQQVDEHGNLRGEKTVSSKSRECGELVKTAALAVSLAIDDLAITSPSAPSGPTAPESESHAQATPVTAPPPEAVPAYSPPETVVQPVPSPASPVRIDLSAGAQATFALAADAAGGVRLGIDATWRWLRIGLEDATDFAATTALARGEGSLRASLTTSSAHACIAGDVPYLCLAVEAGVFESGATGLARNNSGSRFFLASAIRGGVRFSLGTVFFVGLNADAVAPVRAYEVTVDGKPVFSSPILGFRAGSVVGATIF